jgi:putative component of membrane protein insertase Oxa1/YidC/SpoIIIJ protein YidD
MLTWRIPGALPGILFFFVLASHATTTELASDLFAEGDWAGCRRECERQLVETPRNETADLLGAVCLLRLTNRIDLAVGTLQELSTSATSVNVRAMAAYELGRVEWRRNSAAQAFKLFRQAYLETTSQDLFLHAGCSLDLLIRNFPNIGKSDTVFFQSLETSRALWTPELVKECTLEQNPGSGLLSKPGQWVVAFYRELIRPAIGGRCSLEPSCSEYFKQASEKHGLLGLTIQADRFIREPSVVQAEERPIPVKEGIRYYDPLSDHDEWMKK